jgi:hypothetical protein
MGREWAKFEAMAVCERLSRHRASSARETRVQEVSLSWIGPSHGEAPTCWTDLADLDWSPRRSWHHLAQRSPGATLRLVTRTDRQARVTVGLRSSGHRLGRLVRQLAQHGSKVVGACVTAISAPCRRRHLIAPRVALGGAFNSSDQTCLDHSADHRHPTRTHRSFEHGGGGGKAGTSVEEGVDALGKLQ